MSDADKKFIQFLNEREGRGYTALYLAVESGNADAVATLLEFKADPEIPDTEGRSPLICALINGRAEIATELLKYGANPNRKIGDTSCLEIAIKSCKPTACVTALLSTNVSVDSKEYRRLVDTNITSSETAERLHIVFQELLKERAKTVSEALKDIVPLPASASKFAPLDIVSMYTGFSVDVSGAKVQPQN